MMYNGRNLNQRKELFQRIQALESQRRIEIESIPDSISDDEYDDDGYDDSDGRHSIAQAFHERRQPGD